MYKDRKFLFSLTLAIVAGLVFYLLFQMGYEEFSSMRGEGYAIGIAVGWPEKIAGGLILMFFTWLLAFTVMRLVKRKK